MSLAQALTALSEPDFKPRFLGPGHTFKAVFCSVSLRRYKHKTKALPETSSPKHNLMVMVAALRTCVMSQKELVTTCREEKWVKAKHGSGK